MTSETLASNITSSYAIWPPVSMTTDSAWNATSDVRKSGGDELDDVTLVQLERQLMLTRFVVQKILSPIVVAFGLVGNSINIAVLTRRCMRSSTNFYLTSLAVYDILYLIFAFSLALWHFDGDIKTMHGYVIYRWHIGKPVTDTCSNTGVWLTLTFTIERYIGVCLPMKGKVWCTPQRAKYIIAAVCLAAAIITFPEFFEFKVVTAGGATVADAVARYEHEARDFARHRSYQVGFEHLIQTLFTFLPLVLLMVFNSLLIRAVMAATRKRKTMAAVAAPARSERQERAMRDQQRITVMLIIVVIVFLLCQLPQAVQHLYMVYITATDQLTTRRRYILTITANMFNLFVMINSSINFVLYSAFSTKFRRTFNNLFCGYLRKGQRTPADLVFSEAATHHSSPPDDSRTHLLQNRRPSPGNHNWVAGHPAKNGQGQPHTGPSRPPVAKDTNGYPGINPHHPGPPRVVPSAVSSL